MELPFLNVSTACLPLAPGIEKKKSYTSVEIAMGLNQSIIGLTEKLIVFASEIKAIIKHPDYEMGVDLDALNEYFTFQNIFSYNTLFKGVICFPLPILSC